MINRKATPETIVKSGVRQYMRLRGWFIFNIVQNAFSTPGLTDMVAVKDGQVLFIECKGEKGKQSPHQIKFQQDIEAKGGKYLLIRDFNELKSLGY